MKLIKNENLKDEMGQRSREMAIEMSWKRTAKEYMKLYKRVTSE